MGGGGGQRKTWHHLTKIGKVEGVGASPRDSLYEPSVGDVVAVRFHAKQVRARVVDVASPSKPPRFCGRPLAACGGKCGQLVRCSSLRPRTDTQKLVVKVGAKCKVPWGDSSDEYDAEVVRAPLVAAVRLHCTPSARTGTEAGSGGARSSGSSGPVCRRRKVSWSSILGAYGAGVEDDNVSRKPASIDRVSGARRPHAPRDRFASSSVVTASRRSPSVAPASLGLQG